MIRISLGPTQGMLCMVEDLRKWSKNEKKSFRFAVPMIWRKPRNHSDDCYFCSIDVTGYNSKNKKVIFYPNLPSAIRPVGHGPGLSVPQVPETIDDVVLDACSDTQSDEDGQDDEFKSITENLKPQLFTQIDLNDLVLSLIHI